MVPGERELVVLGSRARSTVRTGTIYTHLACTAEPIAQMFHEDAVIPCSAGAVCDEFAFLNGTPNRFTAVAGRISGLSHRDGQSVFVHLSYSKPK